jgi:hypothetical protein
MGKHLPDDVKHNARALYEGTTLTHAAIGAEVGVAPSTVSVWAAAGGWTRPRGARVTARLVTAQRATVSRLFRNGARAGDVAAVAGCHRRTVGRIAAMEPFGPDEAAPGADAAPHLAELRAALLNPGIRKDEAAPLITRAAAALTADALVAPDAQAERTARALANLAHCLAALPDHGPHAGGAHDPYAGPQTFEETNACLEELAMRLEQFSAEVEEREERERQDRLSACGRSTSADELGGP